MSGKAESVAGPGNRFLAALLAWAIPGAGHFYLRRRPRALVYLALVVAALMVGVSLQGRLPWVFSGSPLAVLATLGCMGSGLPFFILHFGLDYQGSVTAAGYEYGSAFILTAGLMNLLLILDAWDIATGEKE